MKTEALSWFQLLFRQPSTFFKIFSVIIRIPVHICWNRHVNPLHLTRSQREMRSEILRNMKYVSALLDSLQRTEDFKHEKCCEILLMDRKHSSLLRFLEDDRAVQGQIHSSLASYSLCDSQQDGEVWTRTTRRDAAHVFSSKLWFFDSKLTSSLASSYFLTSFLLRS